MYPKFKCFVCMCISVIIHVHIYLHMCKRIYIWVLVNVCGWQPSVDLGYLPHLFTTLDIKTRSFEPRAESLLGGYLRGLRVEFPTGPKLSTQLSCQQPLSFRRLLVYQSLPGTLCHVLLADGQWSSQPSSMSRFLTLEENSHVNWNPPAALCSTVPSSFLPALSNIWPAGAVLVPTHDWEG